MRRIIGLLLGMSLAVALLGVGLNAALTTPNLTQQVTVSGISLTVTSSTPGIVVLGDGTIQCPKVAVNASSQPTGSDPVGCQFTVTAGGTLPATVTVSHQSSVQGNNAWKVNYVLSTGPADWFSFSSSKQPLETVPGSALPFSVQTHISWAGLTDADIGTDMTMTYSIAATA